MQRALVCDGDHGIRGLIELLLRQAGLDVEAASTGNDALERILAAEHAVIVLDMMLPRLGGEEIVEAIAREHPHKLSRIILTTSAAPALHTSEALSRVAAVLLKPFDIDLLRETVRAVAAWSPS